MSAGTRIRIGVSTCLLGMNVRHDGGHKHDRFLTETLGKVFDWVSVCPEVEMGMGTPREPIQLMRAGGAIRLVGVRSAIDHTEAMRTYARSRLDRLVTEDISGYVLKESSPSCGFTGVRVHNGTGRIGSHTLHRPIGKWAGSLPARHRCRAHACATGTSGP